MNVIYILLVSLICALAACANQKAKQSEETITSNNAPSKQERPPVVKVESEDLNKLRRAWKHCVAPTEDTAKIKITPRDEFVQSDLLNTMKVNFEAKIEQRVVGGLNPDLKNKELTFLMDGKPIAKAISDFDGIARLKTNIAVENMKASCIAVTYDQFIMFGRMFAIPSQQKIFVTDIDEVISDLKEIQVPTTSIQNNPAIAGAVEALNKLNEHYFIVYLTARDDALENKTKSWLAAKGFPVGPLKVWDWTRNNTLGSSRKEQGDFKMKYLLDLKRKFPNIVAGVGNRSHDAAAYQGAGIKAFIINSKDEPKEYSNQTIFVKDWSEILKYLKI